MARVHVFADESGNLDFSRRRGASRFFILTTVTLGDCRGIGADFAQLRQEIAWEGFDHPGVFHGQADPNPVRQRVFDVLGRHEFRVDALVMEKAKAQPQTRSSPERFYKYAWFYLMKYLGPRIADPGDELLVVAASLGTKRRREAFFAGVQSVMVQVRPTTIWRTACWDVSVEPCLQAADYCGWAVQRKWETGATEHYDLIRSRIRSEFDLWGRGTDYYY